MSWHRLHRFFAPFDDQEKDQWSAAARASTVALLVGMDS
jgi:hypothetical protein